MTAQGHKLLKRQSYQYDNCREEYGSYIWLLVATSVPRGRVQQRHSRGCLPIFGVYDLTPGVWQGRGEAETETETLELTGTTHFTVHCEGATADGAWTQRALAWIEAH